MKCETCRWWVAQHALSEEEYCHLNPAQVLKSRDSWCSHWEDKGCEETLSDNGVQVCMTCNYMMPDPSRRLGQICVIWKKRVMEYHWCNRWELVTTPEAIRRNEEQIMGKIKNLNYWNVMWLHNNIGQEIWL